MEQVIKTALHVSTEVNLKCQLDCSLPKQQLSKRWVQNLRLVNVFSNVYALEAPREIDLLDTAPLQMHY